MTCNTLIIDSESNLRLLKEVIPDLPTPIQIKYTTSISDAMEIICNDPPDIIFIGSGILLKEGFEILVDVKKILIVLVCDLEGFDVLLKNKSNNVIFVTRPVDTDGIPELIQKALEFCPGQKEKL